jgi:hypothetical protein
MSDMSGGNGGPVNEPLPEPDTREPEGVETYEVTGSTSEITKAFGGSDDEIPEMLKGIEHCAHEVKPELLTNEHGLDGMKFTVLGHKIGEPHADNEIFSFAISVPGAAVLASQILDVADESDGLTKMISSMALARFEAEKAPVNPVPTEDDPMAMLAALLGIGENTSETDGPKVRGVRESHTDDPARLLDLDGSGRRTFAPVDNRKDFGDMDMGGYL